MRILVDGSWWVPLTREAHLCLVSRELDFATAHRDRLCDREVEAREAPEHIQREIYWRRIEAQRRVEELRREWHSFEEERIDEQVRALLYRCRWDWTITEWPTWRVHFTREGESASGSPQGAYREP
jgi:hypothetical protein